MANASGSNDKEATSTTTTTNNDTATTIDGIYSSNDNGNSSSFNPTVLSSWFNFNNIKEQFNDMVDEQRMERLQHCRQIEDVYTECRRFNKMLKLQNKNQPPQSSTETTTESPTLTRSVHLEDITPGIRILKYYDWRNMHDYDHKCSREKHAIWACRAGALQCGHELVQLRNCFNALQMPKYGSTEAIQGERNYGAILNTSTTAYEPNNKKAINHSLNTNNSSPAIPCQELQERLGLCIANNATALAQRELDRKSQANSK